MLLVEPHHLLLHLLRIVLVLRPDILHQRLHPHLRHLRTHRLLVQRKEHDPHQDAEQDEHPTPAEAQGLVHPVQDRHHDRDQRADHRLQPPPADRVHVL